MDRGYQGQGSVARRIMDLARWAASADNAQPWRFEFTGNHGVRVHAHDLRADSGVFDYQGAATQLALGGLIETASQAASLYGCGTQVQWGRTGVPSQYEFDLNFEPQAGLAISPLARCISSRATQRGALSRQALSAPDKQALQRAVGPYQILWLEGADRRATAWLNYRLAGPRLAMPESYPNLAVAFDPDANALYTPRRMPVASTPLDPVSRRLVVWALQNQRRMQRTSAVLGTAMTRLQLDLLPGLRCGAHLALLAPLVPNTLADHVCAGRTFARLWLTAEQLGLRLQPEYTAVEFARQMAGGQTMTGNNALRAQVKTLVGQFAEVLAPMPVQRCVMLARVGYGPKPRARSVRLPLEELLHVRA